MDCSRILCWIESNISWVEDAFGLVFSLVATIVTVLTYRRARYTLLQPIRTEVIKRQTDLFSDLLSFLDGEIDDKIDYVGIIDLNFYLYSKECGFEFFYDEQTDNPDNFYSSIMAGVIVTKNCDKLKCQVEFDPFEYISLPERSKEDEIATIKKHANGDYENDNLAITHKYYEFRTKLFSFINNPLVPSTIKEKLIEFDESIKSNIIVALSESLNGFFSEVCRRISIESNSDEVRKHVYKVALYDLFHENKIDHFYTVHALRELIRDYLLVDRIYGIKVRKKRKV